MKLSVLLAATTHAISFLFCTLMCVQIAGQVPIPTSNGGFGRPQQSMELVVQRPTDLALDGSGSLFVIESLDTIRILRIDLNSGLVETYAGNGNQTYSGDDGPAIKAGLGFPTSIAVDSKGNLYISSIDGKIRRVDAKSRRIKTVAGNGRFSQDGFGDNGPCEKAGFGRPADMVFDSNDNLFVVDDLDHRVRRIDANSRVITTYAGGELTNRGDDSPAAITTLKFPNSIGLDSDGNLYIADFGNHRVLNVDARTMAIKTIAGNGGVADPRIVGSAVNTSLRNPRNIAVDGAGNIYVNGGWGHEILRVDSFSGMLSRYVGNGRAGYKGDGGKASNARIRAPSGMVIDKSGNFYFADYGNNRIRKVDAKTGIISTLMTSSNI